MDVLLRKLHGDDIMKEARVVENIAITQDEAKLMCLDLPWDHYGLVYDMWRAEVSSFYFSLFFLDI